MQSIHWWNKWPLTCNDFSLSISCFAVLRSSYRILLQCSIDVLGCITHLHIKWLSYLEDAIIYISMATLDYSLTTVEPGRQKLSMHLNHTPELIR